MSYVNSKHKITYMHITCMQIQITYMQFTQLSSFSEVDQNNKYNTKTKA